jgi:hypothetical protein
MMPFFVLPPPPGSDEKEKKAVDYEKAKIRY